MKNIALENTLILKLKPPVFDYSFFNFSAQMSEKVTSIIFLRYLQVKKQTYLKNFTLQEQKILYNKLYAIFWYLYITKNAFFLSFYTQEYSTEDNPPFFDTQFVQNLNNICIEKENFFRFSAVKQL